MFFRQKVRCLVQREPFRGNPAEALQAGPPKIRIGMLIFGPNLSPLRRNSDAMCRMYVQIRIVSPLVLSSSFVGYRWFCAERKLLKNIPSPNTHTTKTSGEVMRKGKHEIMTIRIWVPYIASKFRRRQLKIERSKGVNLSRTGPDGENEPATTRTEKVYTADTLFKLSR